MIKLGGIGGFACIFIFGWVALYDKNDSCGEVDSIGNEFEDGDVDGAGLKKSDVAELDPEPQFWLISGNGYSNRVSIAKGVHTISEDGE